MNSSLFTYHYPEDLVAQHPRPQRESSRMMVLNKAAQTWKHSVFKHIVDELHEGDVLILNNAQADFVLFDGRAVPPLPPYIKRKSIGDFSEEDFERYKTVYACKPGSKAAPTAGFHFTHEILDTLAKKGVTLGYITLHVGHDTFKPIRSETLEQHEMHGEFYEIPEETLGILQKGLEQKRRIIAGGTTTVRALESWARGLTPPTRLFLRPGDPFLVVNGLLTNFHRPRSTVLVLVCAFAGTECVLNAYEEAVREKYRLFSYGDCLLIL